ETLNVRGSKIHVIGVQARRTVRYWHRRKWLSALGADREQPGAGQSLNTHVVRDRIGGVQNRSGNVADIRVEPQEVHRERIVDAVAGPQDGAALEPGQRPGNTGRRGEVVPVVVVDRVARIGGVGVHKIDGGEGARTGRPVAKCVREIGAGEPE